MTPDRFYDQPGAQPIRRLMLDPDVTEIMINGPRQVYVERQGKMTVDPLVFTEERQLNFLIETLIRPAGRSVDASTPYVDFRLPDGSRVNVIIPPLSLAGPVVTIRKFTRTLRKVADLVKIGTLSERMARLLYAAIRARLNVVFSGATGAGKTTTLGIFAAHIPEYERVITIEDTAELDLDLKHVVQLECRQPNVEGEGAVPMETLLRNALRMRPTRIIVGEVRGPEALDMLQAITSGHEGCLAVVHASSPMDAVMRIETMTLMRGLELPLWAVHRQIAAAIDLIVQHERLMDGSRKITRITEVCGVEGDRVELRNLFEFHDDGLDKDQRVKGKWVCTGIEPHFLVKFDKMNVDLPRNQFTPGSDE